jgi:hypothetical protein
MGSEMDGRGIGIQFLADTEDLSLFHSVQTGSGAHSSSYQIGTAGYFTGGKMAGA